MGGVEKGMIIALLDAALYFKVYTAIVRTWAISRINLYVISIRYDARTKDASA